MGVQERRGLRRLRDLRATRSYGIVLALIACSFTLAMALPDGDGTRLTLVTLGWATLVIAVWTSGVHERTVAVTTIVGLVAVALAGLSLLAGGKVAGLTLAITWAVMIAGTPVLIARSLRTTSEITVRAVTGALCVYLLIGMFFAAVYAAVTAIEDTPFFASGEPADTSNLLYFSFVTQATVGYGDFTAATDPGRALAVVEGLLGQIYLVTVVALIVGNIGRTREARTTDG